METENDKMDRAMDERAKQDAYRRELDLARQVAAELRPAIPPPSYESSIVGKARRRWEGTPEARAKLVAEWALAQLEYEEIVRDTKGQIGNRFFEYAPLVNLTTATRKALASHGIITVQDISSCESNPRLHTLITEVTGHGASCISELDFTPAKLVEEDAPRSDRDSNQVMNLKEYGKQTTYLRRYAYQCKHVLDATADADEAPQQAQAPRAPVERPAPRREPPSPPKKAAAGNGAAPPAESDQETLARIQAGRAAQDAKLKEQVKAAGYGKPEEKPIPFGGSQTGIAVQGPGISLPDVDRDGTPMSEPTVEADDLTEMADAALFGEVRTLAASLGIDQSNKTKAADICQEITGKRRMADLDRAGVETLVRGLRKRVAALAAESAQP